MSKDVEGGMSAAEYERCRSVLKRHEAQLLSLQEVVGVGIGQSDSGRPGLVLLLRRETEATDPELTSRLPEELEGVPVWHRVIGSVEPQEDRPPGDQV